MLRLQFAWHVRARWRCEVAVVPEARILDVMTVDEKRVAAQLYEHSKQEDRFEESERILRSIA